MNKSLDSRRTWQFGLATLFVTAATGYFSNGLAPVWWLAWIAPLPALVLAPRMSKLACFSVSFVGWSLAGLDWWGYLHKTIGIPLPIFILAVITPALAFSLGVLLARTFLIRGAFWRAALALPSVWVTYEYLSASISPHSTFGNLAYSQMNFLPIIQVASITGVWGIEFLVFLLPSSIAALLFIRPRDSRWKSFAVSAAVIFVAVLAWGSYRSLTTAQQIATIPVGLVASDLRENIFPQTDDKGMRTLEGYTEPVNVLASQGAKTIVLPEKIATISDAKLPEVDQLFQSAADKNHVDILVGIDRRQSSGYLNEARLYHSDHRPVTSYVKHHLIPGLEGRDIPGSTFSVLQKGSVVEGIAICKDMDFPGVSRHYGQSNVALLLVPAWDFDTDGWLHGRMAIMRGVENGFTIARSPKQGLLTVSDDRGRILAESRSDASPFSSVMVRVPVQSVATIYSRLGNWFAWVNILLVIWLVGSAASPASYG